MPLLNSISHSYNNYEEQIAMSQRAMRISSDELFDANSKLRNDAEKKGKIIDTFNNCLKLMNVKAAKYGHKEMEVEELADFIETQAAQMHQIQLQREELLHTLNFSFINLQYRVLDLVPFLLHHLGKFFWTYRFNQDLDPGLVHIIPASEEVIYAQDGLKIGKQVFLFQERSDHGTNMG